MIVVGFDAIHENVSKLPRRCQAAGYTTGTPNIRWTDADWGKFPGAVRIDQDGSASDPSADVLDVESGAATPAECPGWAKKAAQDWASGARLGQRKPAIYASASNLTAVANALNAGGITSGVGLWVANWSLTEAQAIADVQNASGPFPIIAVQYSSGQFFDSDIFDHTWLTTVSGGFAANPVTNLHVAHRGYTSITLAWDRDPHATSYSVTASRKGEKVKSVSTLVSSARIGFLRPGHTTYEFKVRAHPGGSQGADATVNGTTR